MAHCIGSELRSVHIRSWHGLIALATVAAVLFVCLVAQAAEFDGVQIPDTMQVGGKTLKLNGFGLRNYSILLLNIHIYVASLYLEHPSSNPEQIMRSPETKLLIVRFEHDVDAERARKAWSDGLQNNCVPPCYLDPADVQQFLTEVPAMQAGDVFTLLFTRQGATVALGGRQIGAIPKPQFADAMLATYLGPRPASPRLKQDLLRGHP
jgi:hypothetical protein